MAYPFNAAAAPEQEPEPGSPPHSSDALAEPKQPDAPTQASATATAMAADKAKFRCMDNDELLRTERDLYTIYCKYALRNGVTATTGTASAVITAGASMLITGPLLTSRAFYLRTVSQKLAVCSAVVKERGLTSLSTPYWQIAGTGAVTLTLGVVALIVQVPGVDGVVDWLVPDVVERAIEHALEEVADVVAEEVAEHVIETATGQAVLRSIDTAATETITWLQHSAVADALHDTFGVHVDAWLQTQNELLSAFLHDNAAIKDKLGECIYKHLNAKVEQGLLALVSVGLAYVARNDLDTFLAMRLTVTDPTEARRLTRDFVFAPQSNSKLQESRGVWDWMAGRQTIVRSDVSPEYAKMDNAELMQAERNLITETVGALRGVLDTTATSTKSKSTLVGDSTDRDAAATEYTFQVETLAMARSLVLLHYELTACLAEIRQRKGLRRWLKMTIDVKCASAALVQTAIGITQLEPAPGSALRSLVVPSNELGSLQATWVGVHLRQQIWRIQDTQHRRRCGGMTAVFFVVVLAILFHCFWHANAIVQHL